MYGDEDLLAHVVDRRLRDAKATGRSPHEGKQLLIDRLESHIGHEVGQMG
jgi:hypothetical protein